jgi:hypothetical protein
MIQIQRYICENCQKEFDDSTACSLHEKQCLTPEEKVNRNFENALQRIIEIYNIKVLNKDINFSVTITENEDLTISSILINLDGELQNGKKFSINTVRQMILSVDDFYQLIEQYILPLIDIDIEGTIVKDDDDNYFDPYSINNKSWNNLGRILIG